jgi:hypothetical protein
MVKKAQIIFRLIFSIAFLITINFSFAQGSIKRDRLYKEIEHMDSVMFNAFNSRDLETFKTLFTEDLEFYHDRGGLTGYDHTIDFLKTTKEANSELKRELVKGSLQVYPIPGYGAMEIGSHTFCHPENGKIDCGTFKFVHVWKKVGSSWKISRVISYDHN